MEIDFVAPGTWGSMEETKEEVMGGGKGGEAGRLLEEFKEELMAGAQFWSSLSYVYATH